MPQKDMQAGEKRRADLLQLLKTSAEPLKAAALAKQAGVSRQVIVQDMNLLRARQEPIMATPNGYMYMAPAQPQGVRRTIVSRHTPAETEDELNTLVDFGVTVLDVSVEHSVYGRIYRPLGLKTRKEVSDFIVKMAESKSALLCSLTDGIHLHTLEASSDEALDQACASLMEKGFLVSESIATEL